MNRRADAARGSFAPASDPEHSSGVGPASTTSVTQWPLSSYLELGALPSAVPSARLHARLVVGEWGFGDLADTVELVVSELVTNAVQASTGLLGSRFQGRWSPGPPPVRLWLQADRHRVLISVWDGSDRMPQRQKPEPYKESGHGLVLVETLCARCGTYALEEASGKVVWAEAAIPPFEFTEGGLPKRPLTPEALLQRPISAMTDPETLKRVRDGLKRM
jgi:anti-sigma regulatory factor (Ser/Thr protein kinase)